MRGGRHTTDIVQLDASTIVAILAIIASSITVFVGYVVHSFSGLGESVAALKSDIQVLKLQVAPIWDFIMKEVPKLLHSDTDTYGLDYYIDKWNEPERYGKLDLHGLQVFRDKLLAIIRDGNAPEKYAVYGPMMVWALNAEIVKLTGEKMTV